MINIRDLIVNQGFAKAILGTGGGAAVDGGKEVELFSKKSVGGFISNPEYNGLYTAELAFPESGMTDNVCDSFSVAVGGIYIVEWDGTEYEVVGQDANNIITNSIILGNASAFGLSGNNEPFVVGVVNGYGLTFASLTETIESHTIRIYQKAAFHLQEKTITENGEYTADDGFDGLGKVLVEVAGSGGGSAKVALGTIDKSTVSAVQTITHGLGVIPDIIMIRPASTGGSSTKNAYRSVFGVSRAFATKFSINMSSVRLQHTSTYADVKELRSDIALDEAGASSSGIIHLVDSETFKMPAMDTIYTYYWVAIAGLT